jgi:uncharacterized FlgJ-related protein
MIERLNVTFAVLVSLLLLMHASPARSQEVIIFASIDDGIAMLKKENFWGEEKRGEQLEVPKVILTGINPRWREASQKLTVPEKKEIFYRVMLPLVLHANNMVLERRAKLLRIRQAHGNGDSIAADDLAELRNGVVLMRVMDAEAAADLSPDDKNFDTILDEMLIKVDIIPAGLALGQAAYESGYGTSRFAIEGNALFGQWTFGGKGLAPEQQRQQLGDYRIATFDWPFDSVRGYFINLMSHPAYADFRKLRAETRAAGKPLDCLTLANGLTSYSERGQEYVDTLKGIIRVNHLQVADDAVFRDEPMRFAIGVKDEAAAIELQGKIEAMRKSGELARIIRRMQLE